MWTKFLCEKHDERSSLILQVAEDKTAELYKTMEAMQILIPKEEKIAAPQEWISWLAFLRDGVYDG